MAAEQALAGQGTWEHLATYDSSVTVEGTNFQRTWTLCEAMWGGK